ncbi:MAG: hypothetical protein Q8P67_28865 [archaeon]|nr:hypothetical protein [archaeon]
MEAAPTWLDSGFVVLSVPSNQRREAVTFPKSKPALARQSSIRGSSSRLACVGADRSFSGLKPD